VPEYQECLRRERDRPIGGDTPPTVKRVWIVVLLFFTSNSETGVGSSHTSCAPPLSVAGLCVFNHRSPHSREEGITVLNTLSHHPKEERITVLNTLFPPSLGGENDSVEHSSTHPRKRE